jgi:hypothetical protein
MMLYRRPEALCRNKLDLRPEPFLDGVDHPDTIILGPASAAVFQGHLQMI